MPTLFSKTAIAKTSTGDFWVDYHLWRQKTFAGPPPKIPSKEDTAEDPPPDYEEVEPVPIAETSYYSSLREIRDSLARVKSAANSFAAEEKWGNADAPGQREYCAIICRETRLSFTAMK